MGALRQIEYTRIAFPMGRKNVILLSLAVIALVTLGLVMLTSTGVGNVKAGDYHLVKKQGLFIIMGLIGALVIANVDYRILRPFWIPALVGSCVLLALCYMPGIGQSIKGASRWIKIPGVPQFQPSELAKIFVIIALAAWYAHYQTEGRKFFKGFVWPSILLGIPVLLIFFEKDMGTAAALGAAGVLMMYAAGVRLPYLGAAGLTALGGMALVVMQNPERMGRIRAIFDLESQEIAQGQGFQQRMALNAFQNGGIDGKGLGDGYESRNYLPESHTDFIFPVIGEELGLWFTLGSVFCFVVIMVCGIAIAMQARDVFGRLLAVGLTSVIIIPAMMNIGVCTALLPNTGLPLPFISYGGTNMLFTLLSMGVLVSIHRQTAETATSEVDVIAQKKYCVRL